jgi:hypothetical protein
MGYEPNWVPTAFPATNIPAVEERIQSLQYARDKAEAVHETVRQLQLKRMENISEPFQKGDKVWLESINLPLDHMHHKLNPKRQGPFTILEVLGPATYQLDLPKT